MARNAPNSARFLFGSWLFRETDAVLLIGEVARSFPGVRIAGQSYKHAGEVHAELERQAAATRPTIQFGRLAETPEPRTVTRWALRVLATPPWADRDAIARLYHEAKAVSRRTGVRHHVDHVIPLQGATVTGLHVETNLRVIPARENHRKSNRFDGASPSVRTVQP
mgnify:CR=1 FL=1